MDDEWDFKTAIATKVEPLAARAGNRAYLITLAGKNVGEMFSLRGHQVLGRGAKAELRIRGDGISREHARLNTTDEGVLLEDLGSTNGTFVNGERISRAKLKDGDKIQVGNSIILKFSYHDDLDEGFQRQMYESASRDGLTQIFNKRYFMDHLNTELGFARRHGMPLSLVIFDLDHFKRVNDTYGHPAGDRVLVALARLVAPMIRNEDVFARWGGEEFVILSRSTDLKQAQVLGERIRAAVEQHEFFVGEKRLEVTVSVGIAALPDPEVQVAEDLVMAADKALYEAKRSGRNQVVAGEARTMTE